MSIIEDRLAVIGFGAAVGADSGGWYVQHFGTASDDGADFGIAPLRARDWSVWLDLLRDRPGPPVFCVSRASWKSGLRKRRTPPA